MNRYLADLSRETPRRLPRRPTEQEVARILARLSFRQLCRTIHRANERSIPVAEYVAQRFVELQDVRRRAS